MIAGSDCAKGFASEGVDLISDVLPFGRLLYGEPNATSNAIGYAEHYSRSHDAVIRVYGAASSACASGACVYRGVASYQLTQFPKHLWYFSLQPIMTRDATRPKPFLTGAIQSLNPCSQTRWQFVGLGTPTACQRKPKLRQIRIALAIFRFIDFTSFFCG